MNYEQITNKLNSSIQAIESILDEFGEVVADRKRDELRAGINADGKGITPIYSSPYLSYKKGLSTYYATGGSPDLYVSGYFHKSIGAKRDGRTKKGAVYLFILNNAPSYAKYLKERYSEPSGISPQGEQDLDNKLRLKIGKAVTQAMR